MASIHVEEPAMHRRRDHGVVILADGELLRLNDGVGLTVAVEQGLVWITQEDDPDDVMLGPGGRFTVDRPGLTLVQALQPSRAAVLGRGHALLERVLPAVPRLAAWVVMAASLASSFYMIAKAPPALASGATPSVLICGAGGAGCA